MLPKNQRGCNPRKSKQQAEIKGSEFARIARDYETEEASGRITRRPALATILGGVPEDADQPIPRRIWTQRSPRPRLRLAYARPEFRKTPWGREERSAGSRDGYSPSKLRHVRSVFAAPETEGDIKA